MAPATDRIVGSISADLHLDSLQVEKLRNKLNDWLHGRGEDMITLGLSKRRYLAYNMTEIRKLYKYYLQTIVEEQIMKELKHSLVISSLRGFEIETRGVARSEDTIIDFSNEIEASEKMTEIIKHLHGKSWKEVKEIMQKLYRHHSCWWGGLTISLNSEAELVEKEKLVEELFEDAESLEKLSA